MLQSADLSEVVLLKGATRFAVVAFAFAAAAAFTVSDTVEHFEQQQSPTG